ncbi:hypothetical protein CROQUDRAFT_670000 [Cronartium quercuum f. sp. fusiforme G11]|uniref:Secreted protein n=1 Tax=Cronartium quercuum f. sp. fusiforme G11 TaxID=708437 RepID=A0A9P6TDE1_9BASI|nr:hypothetical protein CROQUDRAFT_670000 [Cronartium quercuum f. sp. fusiforme G11]
MHFTLSFVMAVYAATTIYACPVKQAENTKSGVATKTWGSGGAGGFGQIISGFSGFESQCNSFLGSFQQPQVEFGTAFNQFNKFCDSFDFVCQKTTSINSFRSIQGTAFVSQFQSIFVFYTYFTQRLILVCQSRWNTQFHHFGSLFQKFIINYQRLFGVAVSIGIDVQSVISGLNLNFKAFAAVGLNLKGLLALDGSTLIHGHGILGSGLGVGGRIGL